MARLRWRKATCLVFVGALLFALSIAAPARADLVTRHVTFSATGFTGTDDAPYQTVTGTFDITFDPALNYSTAPANIHFDNLDPNVLGSDFIFDFSYSNSGYLYVGGKNSDTSNEVGDLWSHTNDFILTFENFDTTTPSFWYMDYAAEGSPYLYSSHNGTVSLDPVPVPPSLLLLGAGLIPLAWYQRRRNRLRE